MKEPTSHKIYKERRCIHQNYEIQGLIISIVNRPSRNVRKPVLITHAKTV